jgi:hypothetical protein
MTIYLVQFAALFLLALVTGVFWGPWLSLHRSNRVFSPSEFIHIVQTMVGNLATPMRILMPFCILFLILSTWLYPLKPSVGFCFSTVALLLSLTALLITILVEVPIVKQINQWTTSNFPADWQAVRDRWNFFHVLRTFCSVGSFACFAISLMLLIK